ncbi:MAG: hypothetical protein KDA24_30350, partial [Deltaproteobacteria bacterium]|nr:hypothetical protein [Deltaproteobacteria bacterium]
SSSRVGPPSRKNARPRPWSEPGAAMRSAARSPQGDGVVVICGRGRIRVVTEEGEQLHEWWMPGEGFAAPTHI